MHLSNSIGELYQQLKDEYVVILADEITMCPRPTHEISVYIINKDDKVIPTFLQPTALLLESPQIQRGDEAFRVPNTLVIATGAQKMPFDLLLRQPKKRQAKRAYFGPQTCSIH